jgi:hypothetical protein
MNEELEIAIDEIRLRGDAPWFIPVVLSGEVPDRTIGRGRTLRDIHFVRLTSDNWSQAIDALCRTMGKASAVTDPTAVPSWAAPRLEMTGAEVVKSLHRLSGVGQQASALFDLSAGLWRISLSHRGTGHFAALLLDSDGERVELLSNTTGPFHGTKLVQIKREGEYLCDVSGDDAWEILIAPPMQLEEMTHVRGESQSGTDLIQFNAGLRVFSLQHEGGGHFAVWLLDRFGKRMGLLVNTTGRFDGSKAVRMFGGWYALDVQANGPWSVSWR